MMQRVFSALSNPSRLQIVLQLSHMHQGKAIVDEEGHVFDDSTENSCCLLTESASRFIPVIEHLYELESAGLVSIGHRDKYLTCALRTHALKSIGRQLLALSKLEKQNGCS